MNILILNWRDPKNPRSGGAESVTFKYAMHWASRGHTVTWLCNSFEKSLSQEIISQVQFIRIGPSLGYTVLQLLLTYPIFLVKTILKSLELLRSQHFDLVIDEIHGLPFFTPFYSPSRSVLWVCEVAGPIWDRMFPFPINIIGKWLERCIYWAYRNTEIWAISKSTRSDILTIIPQARVKIIPLGLDPITTPQTSKTSHPSAVFLARLVKMKGVETALLSSREIAKTLPNFKLYLVGNGPVEYVDYLKRYAVSLGISSNIEFLGRLSETDKYKVLAKSHFLIHPSYKEGFGLTVLEAGLMATPTIARSGSSLDELIINGKSGLVFKTDAEISKLFIGWYSTPKYLALSQGAKHTARNYLWSEVLPATDGLLKSNQ